MWIFSLIHDNMTISYVKGYNTLNTYKCTQKVVSVLQIHRMEQVHPQQYAGLVNFIATDESLSC